MSFFFFWSGLTIHQIHTSGPTVASCRTRHSLCYGVVLTGSLVLPTSPRFFFFLIFLRTACGLFLPCFDLLFPAEMWELSDQTSADYVISNLGSCPHPPLVLLGPGCLWEGGVGEAGLLGTSGVSPTAPTGLRWVVVELPDGWLVASGPQALCESLSLVPVRGTRLQQIREKKDDNPKPMLHLAVFFFF